MYVTRSLVCLLLVFTQLGIPSICEAKQKKDLWVVGGRFVWGRSPEEMIGIRFPGALTDMNTFQTFPKRVMDYPEAGANTVLVSCQSKGNRFFSPDGKSTASDRANRLLEVVEAIRFWSGTAILTLFDPDPSCRLESEQAYVEAAKWVVEALREEDGFILCLTEKCDDPQWEEGENPLTDLSLVERVAAAIHDASPGRVVAAGAANPEILSELVESMPSVDALMAPVPRLGFGKGVLSSAKKPVIEIVSPDNVSDDELTRAIDKVLEDTSYAFALEMKPDTSEQKRAEILARFSDVSNKYQIERFHGVPRDPEDRFSLQPGEEEEGFISLFNGKNINGWIPLMKFKDYEVADGCIHILGYAGGWLRSYESFGDFVFRCEYSIDPGQNSGIWFRAQKNGRNSRIGFEFQILGTPVNTPSDADSHGAIYDVRPPDKNCALPPGEWNQVEVTCRGSHIKIVWNGQVVHDLSYEDNPLLKNRKKHGYIGLTDHHGSVRFRNIRIKPLD